MATAILYLWHKVFCRDVTWAFPTLAMADSNGEHKYPMRCRECGYTFLIECGTVKKAIEVAVSLGIDPTTGNSFRTVSVTPPPAAKE